VSSADPLGRPAEAASEAAQRLERAIAEAGKWADGARSDFDRRHLEPIRADANGLAAGLQALAERCRRVATRIGNET
jgi:hypothetical protein